jgi:hypothetical protein
MMKIFKYILPLILIIFGFVDCQNQKYDIVRPKDFSFKIIDKTDKYDSRTGIYTRKYLSSDTTVKVVLTEDDMELIYDAFKKCDFMSFPREFISPYCSMPSFSTTIEISYKGNYKIVTDTDVCDRKNEQRKSKKFNKFSSVIWTMMSQKPQVKNMKQCDIIFL